MASPRSINFSNSLEATRAAGNLVNYTHPDYRYFKPDWDLIRDSMAGERRVKEMGELYLPRLGDNAGTSYDAYKSRAVFVNMTARTVSSLIGTIYRRPAKLVGISSKDKIHKGLEQIAPDGASLSTFSRLVTSEVAQVGRVGVLVDLDPLGKNPPYLTYFIAENILAWKTEMIDGKEVLTYVLLREIVEQMLFLGVAGSTAPTDSAPVIASKGKQNRLPDRQLSTRQHKVLSQDKAFQQGDRPVLRAQYRVLALENGEYVQKVYSVVNVRNVDTISSQPDVVVYPTKMGKRLDFIPFAVIGTRGVSTRVTKSPMIDIAFLNMSHYRSSAQLEHGRFFTALPVYYVPVQSGDRSGGEYTVGPSVVWEVPSGEKPGILEYYGTGLRELSSSLQEKEEHIAQLGGRVIGFSGKGQGSQSPEVVALTQASELAVLTLLCDSISSAMTTVLRWWAWWQNVEPSKIEKMEYVLNRDFATGQVGSREMRSIALLYQSGILPISEVYRIFQEAELIAPDVSEEEFISLLEDINQFPNQPDVVAMREGFKDAASRTSKEVADNKDETAVTVAEIEADTAIKAIDKKTAADEAKQRADQKHQELTQQRQKDQQQEATLSPQARQTQQLENRQAPIPKK